MRKPIIAGNWKMNKTIEEASQLIEEIKKAELNPEVETIMCVPFLSIQKAMELTKGTNIKIGAQNMHWEKEGAYTGEISAPMLKELGVEYVILGHSERRLYFKETDEIVNDKLKTAIEYSMIPIICVGENLLEREENDHLRLIKHQVEEALKNIPKEALDSLVIAYEPVWAIGTGKTATAEQADEMCGLIRDTIDELYGGSSAKKMQILYGGSVKPENVKELMNMDNIDGALVGGASLKSKDFTDLVNY
ncbi:MAG: triose-phosphate isomerase [Gudongella sp.]|nr:triose-phosphate isomerase [Gudongella sp.]